LQFPYSVLVFLETHAFLETKPSSSFNSEQIWTKFISGHLLYGIQLPPNFCWNSPSGSQVVD
jgi:hypothetical protein